MTPTPRDTTEPGEAETPPLPPAEIPEPELVPEDEPEPTGLEPPTPLTTRAPRARQRPG